MKTNRKISPWMWIPTLYFAEGIPYFLVNNISVMMFTKMGVPNGDMALFTSLLYLPWTIKPFWSPFVDIFKTKRWWVIAMQLLMTAAFVLLTLTIPHPSADVIASGQTPISLFTVMLFIFILVAFASATHDIAADGFYMLGLSEHEQASFVGIRSTFYRLSSIFGQGVLLVIAGILESRMNNIPVAWQLTLLITSVIFAILTLWHIFFVPRPANDISSLSSRESQVSVRTIVREFIRTFITYFQKKGVLIAILFMLCYRLPEAFLIKMINPFLVAPLEKGGLALPTEDVGIVYGTIGILFLTIGGILGGWFASSRGLKGSLWWMVGCMTLPCLSFVYLSIFQPSNLVAIATSIAIEQFGYGFGFTAYMLYMMYFSEGEFKTAHYAICTAFMALSMMLPGMVAGYLQEAVGYVNFFLIVMLCCLATIGVSTLIKIDSSYGIKK
ncbi:MAG: MFS transporter [Prevotellaceae bacterium]|nr:MFS transporter [Prevotellaceae bacterium]MDD7108019.1 MFS transporter [Prevotellaceae bacterium]